MTTYPAFDAFRRYMYGEGTLEEFRHQPGSVHTPIYADETEDSPITIVQAFWRGAFFGLVIGFAAGVLALLSYVLGAHP